MSTEPVLVEPAKLLILIDKQPDAYQDYLRDRWLAMVIWWDSRSDKAKRSYFSLRILVVVGGVLIPVLTAIHTIFQSHTIIAPTISIALASVGAIVAGAAAWDGVQNYGDVWREKRRAAELLKTEGWLFMNAGGQYAAAAKLADPFNRFVTEVEAMIAREVGEYLKSIDQKNDKAG